ncbi:MAG TPA: hypothetical protein VLJ68_09540 [Chitinophagaceae bacterium]|nr:hypothetical protein [Chitinophagaceae bacterium]
MKSHLFKICMVLIPVLFACNNKKNEPAKGDCQYREAAYPARLIELLEPAEGSGKEGLFEIDFSSKMKYNPKDTVSYMTINKKLIADSEIDKNKVTVGKIYKYVISTSEVPFCELVLQRIELTEY